MRTRIIAAAVAGGLLVSAGFITSIVSAPSIASAQEEEVVDDAESKGFFHRGFDFLSDVLSELVGEGKIDQADADVVLEAVEAKAAEIKEEREALRDLTKDLLEDGVLTEAEAAQLPDDHPLLSDRFDEAWQDGELTTEEIREAGHHPRRDAFRKGARLGALMDDGGIDRTEYAAVIEEVGEDHPIAQIDAEEYFSDDGLITWDELREIHQDLHDSRNADTAA